SHDSKYGFVYPISVFSHFSQRNQEEWLTELARVTRAGGTLMITVHGRHALRRAADDDNVRRMIEISDTDLKRAQMDLDSYGMAFVSQPAGHLNHALYGVSFVTEEYVRRSWHSGFELANYKGAALDNWQDLVVLKRRS